MHRRSVLTTTMAGGLLTAIPAAAQTGTAPAPLAATLAPYLASHGLPAVGAAVVRGGTIVAAGATGTRRADARIPVTIGDRFHLGSCTKAFTALLAGMLVDEGKISWDTTIGARFPDLREGMDAGLAGVTLEQLLSHIGGIPRDNPAIIALLIGAYGADVTNLDEMRRWMLQQWRAKPLASVPGTTFAYSNLGFTIAGAMLERAAGSTWEELVSARIFSPLGLASAGLGPGASRGRTDAPLGHSSPDGGTTLVPVLPGPNGDVPAVYGPAGAVHMSVLDFATWAGWHAGEGKRGPVLVKPETLRRLHSQAIQTSLSANSVPGMPALGGYGHGWGYLDMTWSKGTVMQHTGSNSMSMAMVLVQPSIDLGIVVATNRSDGKSEAALALLLEVFYRQYA